MGSLCPVWLDTYISSPTSHIWPRSLMYSSYTDVIRICFFSSGSDLRNVFLISCSIFPAKATTTSSMISWPLQNSVEMIDDIVMGFPYKEFRLLNSDSGKDAVIVEMTGESPAPPFSHKNDSVKMQNNQHPEYTTTTPAVKRNYVPSSCKSRRFCFAPTYTCSLNVFVACRCLMWLRCLSGPLNRVDKYNQHLCDAIVHFSWALLILLLRTVRGYGGVNYTVDGEEAPLPCHKRRKQRRWGNRERQATGRLGSERSSRGGYWRKAYGLDSNTCFVHTSYSSLPRHCMYIHTVSHSQKARLIMSQFNRLICLSQRCDNHAGPAKQNSTFGFVGADLGGQLRCYHHLLSWLIHITLGTSSNDDRSIVITIRSSELGWLGGRIYQNKGQSPDFTPKQDCKVLNYRCCILQLQTGLYMTKGAG